MTPHATHDTGTSVTHSLTEADATVELRHWLACHERLLVLTGAGVSTGSGIPDYRGPDGLWKRSAPITYQAFMHDPAMRARYWARSFVGWPVVAHALPNRAHAALVALEARGGIDTLVTQNVDGLHSRAGQRNVIDLHGRIDQVICMDCSMRVDRDEVQRRLAADHPHWEQISAAAAPDGDAQLGASAIDGFRVPSCPACGGLLKPDVVFFGENVPRERVVATQSALARVDAMLVIGSSLMVYSGFRFARMARERDLPLAILTRGFSRADEIATLKLDADCEAVLSDAIAN